MKAIQSHLFGSPQSSKFWLLGIATGLAAIHLTLTWKRGYVDLWGISVLLWIVVYYSLYKRRNTLSLEANFTSGLFGTLLVALVLLESTYPVNKFPYISPFISALGLGLVASGFKGLKQYWQELLILIFPAMAYVILLFVLDLPVLTARFATFVLWYLGFQVSQQGVNITLPTGGIVEVNQTCSGQGIILQLWTLAVLFLLMFPIDKYKRILVSVVASFLAFVINGLRVVLLAILIEFSYNKSFEYWHTGDGSLIFSMIAVSLFGLFCLLLIRLHEPKKQETKDF